MSGKEPKDDKNNGFRARLSAFLKWIEPYRVFVGLLVALVIAISGAVSWAVAHFATQQAVSYLECKITHQMTSHVDDAQANLYASEIDARGSQIKELMERDPPFMAPVNRLLTEQQNLTTQKDAAASAAKDQLNEAIVACKP
jgi:hypothetical protein